ncbi:MAG: hypothetical protein GY815_06270 [Gammaproteobacteria bacterium]|nr:hypothetical protein [Gammaproteobacteria bacterium]
MKQNFSTAQAGYALLLTVLALMGIGGVVLAGFTQGVKVESEHERYLHNQRVLREAKQALLQYAYNYPVTAGNGPGRLPCPDIDGNGNPDPVPGCDGVAGVVGRFPWKTSELNFYEARDASGEELWYAVSNNFGNSGLGDINSSTRGTILVQDRSGARIHDNATGNGVVAVIIAPGPPIRSAGVLQDRAAGPNVSTNYLDRFGGIDNGDFSNNPLALDGFVTGPITDVVSGDLLVNDQMIVVTAAEVIAMAEKATLQAYRAAINNYLNQTGGVYPWLYNYADATTAAELNRFYPALVADDFDDPTVGVGELVTYLGNYGRIPSIFAEFFTLTVSQPIASDLKVTLTIDYDAITPVPATISHGNLPLLNPPMHVLEFTIPADELTGLRFTEDAANPNGRLTATLAAARTFNQALYFWDEAESPRTGDWRLCPNGADELSDCHRDSSQNPDPGGVNDSDEEILILDIEVSFPAGEITFDADYSTLPVTGVIAADGDGHATISGTIQGSALDLVPATSPSITVSWQYDAHYLAGEGFTVEENDDLDLADLLGNTTMALEMRYYPELPAWALDNGWHNSIMMAYADDYRPDTLTNPCTAGTDCLEMSDIPGGPHDKVSLVVIAGEHGWSDDNDPGLQDDLPDVFDAGNADTDPEFLAHDGNDEILVIDEL